MKILLIIPYFGTTPAWFNFFLKSSSLNSQITWLLYGDLPEPKSLPKNIIFHYSSIKEFSELVSNKLAVTIDLSNPYKICDFRPAFGKIFEDYTIDYDFWGYSDLDIIYGDISTFIPLDKIDKYDIIASRNDYYPGHFMLFKNNNENKFLFKKIFRYSGILEDTKRHYAIDERSNLIGKAFEGVEIPTLSRKILYKVLRVLPFNHDLNTVLSKVSGKDKNRILRLNNSIRSDYFYMKKGVDNWEVEWKDGKLYDMIEKRELMYFHFLKSKNNLKIKSVDFKAVSSFKINKKAIHLNK